MLKKLSVHWYIIYLAIYRTLFKWNLGEHVRIQGYGLTKWILYQGVDDPYWKASCLEGHIELSKTVHKRYLRKVWELSNLIKVFNSCRKFYLSNWFDIWVHRLEETNK